MRTFLKSDEYCVAANITEYHTISKLIFIRIKLKLKRKAIISCKKCI